MPRRGEYSRLNPCLFAAAAAAAAVAAAVVACSSFSSSSVAAAPEGGVDSSVGDGAGDGGADTGVVGNDAAVVLPFCAAHPNAILCDDFDDPGRAVWNPPALADGGSLAVVPAVGAPSQPNALRATAVSTLTTTCTYVLQDTALDAGAPNGFHLEFKVRADKLPAGVRMGPAVKMEAALETCEYYLTIGPTGIELAQEHKVLPTTALNVGRKLRDAAWTTVTIDLEGHTRSAHNQRDRRRQQGDSTSSRWTRPARARAGIIGSGVGLYASTRTPGATSPSRSTTSS